MTLMERRRALMAGRKEIDKTPIMPSCLNWYYTGGGNSKALSDDSYQLVISSGWQSYSYATRSLSLKYSDLVGKTIVIEYDTDNEETWLATHAYVGLVGSNPNYTGGNGHFTDRNIFTSTSGKPNHYYEEITVGKDYVSTATNYYLTVGGFSYSTTAKGIVKITNFKCYIKGAK